MKETRVPIGAGSFYPQNKEELIKEIKECFRSKLGPGEVINEGSKHGSEHKEGYKEENNITKETKGKEVVSAIVPHAGYRYSGMCCAHVYKELLKYRPETVIILGTDHEGLGSGLGLKNWLTPLGTIEVDGKFCKCLIENRESGIIINEESHEQEHSIEVQLPFLQFTYNQIKNHKFRIVPITISNDIDTKKAVKALFDTIQKLDRDYIIIASGDFTHYGYNYGYVPFETNIKKNLERLDKEAIGLIVKNDSKGFVDFLNKTKATICGRCGFNVLIELNKLLSLKGRLLKYYTSGDVGGDYKNCVSYAGIVFK